MRICLSPGRERACNRPLWINVHRCINVGTYRPNHLAWFYTTYVLSVSLITPTRAGLEKSQWTFSQGPERWLVENGLFLSVDGCGIMDILLAYIVLSYAFHWYFKNIQKTLKCQFFEDSFTLWQCDLFSKTWHHKTQMTAAKSTIIG